MLSNVAWYSGVRGASCPRPGGLAGSNGGWPTAPGTMALVHWPISAGYIASSNACVAVGMHNAAAVNTIVPIAARYSMTLLQSRRLSFPRWGSFAAGCLLRVLLPSPPCVGPTAAHNAAVCLQEG